VDGFDARLQRLLHRLAIDHTGREALDRIVDLGFDRALAVYGLAQRVHYATDHRFAGRDGHDAAGPADLVAFLNARVIAEQHGANLVLFQVQCNAGDAALAFDELDQLAGHDVFEAVHTRDAVAYGNYRSGFGDVDGVLVIFNFFAQHARDFVC